MLQAAVVEALLGRSLTHPHIVTVYAHGVSEREVSRLGAGGVTCAECPPQLPYSK